MKTKLWFAWVLCSLTGCAPMTFSNEPVIDFEHYRSVRVEVTAPETMELPNGSAYGRRYLRDQLEQSSGFERVTLDHDAPVDLVLSVSVSIFPRLEDDRLEYDGRARYSATTPDGVLIDRGSVEDGSHSAEEVIEDVLDEVALRYTKPYRL